MSGGSILDIVENIGSWEVIADAWTSEGQLQLSLSTLHVLQQSQEFVLRRHLVHFFIIVGRCVGQGSSLRSLPCHKLNECLWSFNKPFTVLTPTNNAQFL